MSPTTGGDKEGLQFVVKVIQHLEYKHGIAFFITPRDFDVLYRWREKRIPFRLLKESIANVVERRRAQNKEINSFANFYHEVRKNFNAFLQLSVGAHDDNDETGEEYDEFAEIDHFFAHFPEELNGLREDFDDIHRQVKNNETPCMDALYEKLTALFQDDNELNIKAGVFLRNLAPGLRKPGIEQKYRLNYLINKFNIPDFDIF